MKVSLSGIFWSLISIGVGFFLLYGTWETYSEYQHMQNYSGRAIGNITKKHFKLASDGSGNYYVDYWFMSSVDSKINASSIIDKQKWDILKVNDTLEIRFDASNPNRNVPMYGGSPSLLLVFFMLIMGAVFMLFGCSRFFNSFHKRKSPH